MKKLIGLLAALAMLCAMPAVALAQGETQEGAAGGVEGTQGNTTNQEAEGGGDAVGGEGGGDAQGGDGNALNQNATCQQISGDDSNCEIDQSQQVGGDVEGDDDEGETDEDETDEDETEGDDVTGGDVGGGGVTSVQLAQTGFDAWLLALIGGLSLAGGLGLVAAQRRGRLSA